jgi:predicted PurR-regulated permease PerM
MDRRIPVPRSSAHLAPVATDTPSASREAPPFDARSLLRHLRPYLMGAIVLPVVAALYWGQAVLIPVALASLLTFLLSPLVSGLERLGLARFRAGRAVAVALVVTLVFSALGATTWVIAHQVLALGSELPLYRGNLMRKIADLRVARRSGGLAAVQSTANQVLGELQKGEVPKGESKPVPVVVRSDGVGIWQLPKILEFLGGAAFLLVLVVFMLIEQHEIRNRFIRLIGHGRLASATRALDEAAARISRYLVAQTIVNAVYGTALGLGLYFMGLPYAMMWGFLAFSLRFIPYLGPPMAAMGPVALSLAVFSDWQRPLTTVGLFLVVELITYMALEPLMYGHSTGVSQVALLVALAFWTWLWGPIGLALGTPLTVCLVVLGKHVPALGFINVMMTDEPALPVDVSYYQRLLARDSTEGAEILDGYLVDHSLEEAYDEILVRALSRAKRDRDAQRVSDEEAHSVYQAGRETVEKLSVRRHESSEESDTIESTAVEEAPLVLGCPAADEGDEVALLMFGQLLRPTDCTLEIVPASTLSGEIVSLVSERKPKVVAIGAVPPEGLAQARYLCKRLRARFPDLKVIVGRWGEVTEEGDRASLLEAGADAVASTFAQSRGQLLERLHLV